MIDSLFLSAYVYLSTRALLLSFAPKKNGVELRQMIELLLAHAHRLTSSHAPRRCGSKINRKIWRTPNDKTMSLKVRETHWLLSSTCRIWCRRCFRSSVSCTICSRLPFSWAEFVFWAFELLWLVWVWANARQIDPNEGKKNEIGWSAKRCVW